MVRRRNEELREWTRKVIEKMPHLTKPQAVVLAMWSFGIVMTQSCGLSTVAAFIAAIVGKKEWLWIFANTNFALFHAADTRGPILDFGF
jgi:hypothetical protein